MISKEIFGHRFHLGVGAYGPSPRHLIGVVLMIGIITIVAAVFLLVPAWQKSTYISRTDLGFEVQIPVGWELKEEDTSSTYHYLMKSFMKNYEYRDFGGDIMVLAQKNLGYDNIESFIECRKELASESWENHGFQLGADQEESCEVAGASGTAWIACIQIKDSSTPGLIVGWMKSLFFASGENLEYLYCLRFSAFNLNPIPSTGNDIIPEYYDLLNDFENVVSSFEFI